MEDTHTGKVAAKCSDYSGRRKIGLTAAVLIVEPRYPLGDAIAPDQAAPPYPHSRGQIGRQISKAWPCDDVLNDERAAGRDEHGQAGDDPRKRNVMHHVDAHDYIVAGRQHVGVHDIGDVVLDRLGRSGPRSGQCDHPRRDIDRRHSDAAASERAREAPVAAPNVQRRPSAGWYRLQHGTLRRVEGPIRWRVGEGGCDEIEISNDIGRSFHCQSHRCLWQPNARVQLLLSSLQAAARLPPLDEVVVVLALVPRFGHPRQTGIAQQSLIGLRPE